MSKLPLYVAILVSLMVLVAVLYALQNTGDVAALWGLVAFAFPAYICNAYIAGMFSGKTDSK